MMACGRTIQKIAIIVGVLSLVLQILGYTCPGWVVVAVSLQIVGTVSGLSVVGFGEVVSYSSIWYTKICVVGEGVEFCSHETLHNSRSSGYWLSSTLIDLRQFDWTEVEIILSIALVFCMIGLVLAIVGLCQTSGITATLMTALASAAMLISWALILPAVIKVALVIHDTETAIEIYERSNGTSYTSVRTPWALALSACGLVLALICCVMLLVSSCKHNEKTSGTITPGSTGHTPVHVQTGAQYGYPVITKHMFMREGTEPHMPPQYNQAMLPVIGSKDDAPLEYPQFGLVSYNHVTNTPPLGNVMDLIPPSSPPIDTTLNTSKPFTKENSIAGDTKQLKNGKPNDKPSKMGINAANSKTSVRGKTPVNNGTVKRSTGSKEQNKGKDNDDKPVNGNTKEIPNIQTTSIKEKSIYSDTSSSPDEAGRSSPLEDRRKTPTVTQTGPTETTSSRNTRNTKTGLEYV